MPVGIIADVADFFNFNDITNKNHRERCREIKKGQISFNGNLSSNVASPGIEPGSGASETHILSIVQRGH